MSYANKVAHVTISGSCYTAGEFWTTGFFLGTPGADQPAPANDIAEQVSNHWKTFFQLVTADFSNTYFTREVKVSNLGTDGKHILSETSWYVPATPYGGTKSGPYLPPQISLVGTLTSDIQRGLASKGRMYLPGICSDVDVNTGKISSADRDSIATGFNNFLSDIKNDADIPGQPVLASFGAEVKPPTNPRTWGVGVTANVTGCRIGNVYDTQRRRRAQFIESYATRVLT